jgi:ribosome biogenesis GTPase
MRGQIICTQSGFYVVQTEKGALTCRLRGRLKRRRWEGDIAAIGDWVEVRQLDEKSGVIEAVEPRQRILGRRDPRPRGDYQQVIIANPDQAVLVFACCQPRPRFGMLDRLLVIAEKQALPALIVANKVDLLDLNQAQEMFGHYPPLGYEVVYTSAVSGYGVQTLRECLKGKISVFIGPSGVGKSSLLNAIQPGLGLAVDEISQATGKGKHTTRLRKMFPLEGGGYVADTPGLRALGLWDIEPEELDGYFPEMRLLVSQCEYNDCTHIDEPNCKVRQAVREGRIHAERYRSYINMRLGVAAE